MKRRFAVPAAIALAAHSIIFLGYGRPPVTTTAPVKGSETVTDPPRQIEIIPDPIVGDSEEKGKVSKISEIDGPPVVPEPPPTRIPTDSAITQKWEQVMNGTATTLTAFNVGLPARKDTGNEAMTVSQLDDKPRTRFQKSPVYPRSLKNAGETGTVWVDFVVDERGYVHDARVVKSTNSGFDEATLSAVSEWRFEPGKRKGIPVRFRMSLPLVFDITR